MQPTRLTQLSVPTVTLDDLIGRTADLPALPAAALAVIREADSGTGSAQSVARYLMQDSALAARILRLANSAFYGLPRKVQSIQDAVVVLGMRNVRNLALVASTYPWLSKPLPGYGLAPAEMWRHSFSVAVASSQVAEKSGLVSGDQGFLAGILHDIGKTALSVWLENKLVAVLKIAAMESLSFDAVERKILGFDHTDVGAHMGESWNLPGQLVEVMKYHHRPEEAPPGNHLVSVVHVGDYIAGSMGLGLGGDGLCYGFSDVALERLGLSIEDLEPLADSFMVSYEKHERLFEEATT